MATFSFSSTDSFSGLDSLHSISTIKSLNSLNNTTDAIKNSTEKLPLIEEAVKNNPTEITRIVLEDNKQIKQSLTDLKQDLVNKIAESFAKNEPVWAANLKHVENIEKILSNQIDEEWVKLVKTLKIAELFPIMRCLNELEDIFICDKFSTTDKNPSGLKSQCKRNMQDKLSANESLLKDLEVLYVNWDKNLNIDEQRLERMAKLQIFKRKVIVYLFEIADNSIKARVDIVQPPNNEV